MTIINQEAASRIKILDAPSALPGTCIICGIGKGNEGEDRTFVDFGQDIDFYGAVYFCSFCFAQVATALGFMAKEDYENLVKQVEIYRDQISATYEKEQLANGFLDEVLRVSALYKSSSDLLSSSVAVTETVQDEPRDAVEATSNDSDVDELIGEQGSPSLSSRAGNDSGPAGLFI